MGRCGVSLSGTISAGKKTAHASEQDRPDVLKQREAWFEGQFDFDPERLVFIDDLDLDEHGAALRPCAQGQAPSRGHPARIPAFTPTECANYFAAAGYDAI
jgi:hypothetical protein